MSSYLFFFLFVYYTTYVVSVLACGFYYVRDDSNNEVERSETDVR